MIDFMSQKTRVKELQKQRRSETIIYLLEYVNHFDIASHGLTVCKDSDT